MTEIYIKRNRGRKGCLRGVLLAGAVCILAALAIVFIRRPAAPPPEVPFEDKEVDLTLPGDELESEASQPDRGADLLAQARRDVQEGMFAEARSKCFTILNESSNVRAKEEAEALLSDIHIQLVFARRPMAEKVDYTVQPGDTLGGLAKKFGTTVELIRRGNNIRGSLIRVGDRYRILKGTFSLSIDKSDNELVVYLNDRFFKRYPVGTGKYQRTPAGTFEITDRIPQPTWWRPDGKAIPYGDPDNVLGTHWLSLSIQGYGLHGTWEPETVGQQASEGCVRLLNEDIEELYSLLPVGTSVVITE